MPRKTLKTLCPLNLSSLSKEDAQRRQNNATQQEHLYQQVAEKAKLIMVF